MFCVHYQGQFGRGGEIVGAEALIRFNRPGAQAEAPTAFLEAAKANKTIGQIDLGVFAQVVKLYELWSDQGEDITPFWVNASDGSLKDKRYVDGVIELLTQSRIPHGSINVEVVEDGHSTDGLTDAVCRSILSLRAAGAHIALDDFGTGSSTPAAVKQILPDELKIDQSFVRGSLKSNLSNNGEYQDFVRSALSLAVDVGAKVIVEGVSRAHLSDTFFQLTSEFTNLGRAACQGYHYAKPAPTETFRSIMQSTMGAPQVM